MAKRFLYFAYGSNMLSARLRERAPSAVKIGTGAVRGRRLTFHKVINTDSGKCDVELTGNDGDVVHGVLFEVDASERQALDDAEGVNAGYEPATLDIETESGILKAMAYVATAKDSSQRPFEWYKALVVAGASEHGLPAAYIAAIDAVQAKADPDDARQAKHERLLKPTPPESS